MLALIPIAATLVLGCLQIYLAKTQNLTPWRMGGYGMFSTANDINLRSVQALHRDTLKPFPQISERYHKILVRFRVMPSRELLGRIAQSAACLPEAKAGVVLIYWEGLFTPKNQSLRFQRHYQVEAVCR